MPAPHWKGAQTRPSGQASPSSHSAVQQARARPPAPSSRCVRTKAHRSRGQRRTSCPVGSPAPAGHTRAYTDRSRLRGSRACCTRARRRTHRWTDTAASTFGVSENGSQIERGGQSFDGRIIVAGCRIITAGCPLVLPGGRVVVCRTRLFLRRVLIGELRVESRAAGACRNHRDAQPKPTKRPSVVAWVHWSGQRSGETRCVRLLPFTHASSTVRRSGGTGRRLLRTTSRLR